MVGVVKYFHILGVLSALIFILYGCCPMVLLSILALLCPPTWPAWWEYWSSTPVSWSHDQRFDRTPWWLEYKIFSSFGGFVRLDFYALGLLSYGAFVHYGFSLSAHVTAWRECWSSAPVSCDHITRDLIVHLDGWNSKIFSSFGGFCPPWFLSFGAVVLFCFCPFWLFSVRPCDRMMKMLIVHTCIMWSHDQRWDRTLWWLE